MRNFAASRSKRFTATTPTTAKFTPERRSPIIYQKPPIKLNKEEREFVLKAYAKFHEGVTQQRIHDLLREIGVACPADYDLVPYFENEARTGVNTFIHPDDVMRLVQTLAGIDQPGGAFLSDDQQQQQKKSLWGSWNIKEEEQKQKLQQQSLEDRVISETYDAVQESDEQMGSILEEASLRDPCSVNPNKLLAVLTRYLPEDIARAHVEKYLKHFEDVRSLTNFLRINHQNVSPVIIDAFKRMGAVYEESSGYTLDVQRLRERCLAIGIDKEDIEIVVNLLDRDSSGEVDLHEFIKVVVGGDGVTQRGSKTKGSRGKGSSVNPAIARLLLLLSRFETGGDAEPQRNASFVPQRTTGQSLADALSLNEDSLYASSSQNSPAHREPASEVGTKYYLLDSLDLIEAAIDELKPKSRPSSTARDHKEQQRPEDEGESERRKGYMTTSSTMDPIQQGVLRRVQIRKQMFRNIHHQLTAKARLPTTSEELFQIKGRESEVVSANSFDFVNELQQGGGYVSGVVEFPSPMRPKTEHSAGRPPRRRLKKFVGCSIDSLCVSAILKEEAALPVEALPASAAILLGGSDAARQGGNRPMSRRGAQYAKQNEELGIPKEFFKSARALARRPEFVVGKLNQTREILLLSEPTLGPSGAASSEAAETESSISSWSRSGMGCCKPSPTQTAQPKVTAIAPIAATGPGEVVIGDPNNTTTDYPPANFIDSTPKGAPITSLTLGYGAYEKKAIRTASTIVPVPVAECSAKDSIDLRPKPPGTCLFTSPRQHPSATSSDGQGDPDIEKKEKTKEILQKKKANTARPVLFVDYQSALAALLAPDITAPSKKKAEAKIQELNKQHSEQRERWKKDLLDATTPRRQRAREEFTSSRQGSRHKAVEKRKSIHLEFLRRKSEVQQQQEGEEEEEKRVEEVEMKNVDLILLSPSKKQNKKLNKILSQFDSQQRQQ